MILYIYIGPRGQSFDVNRNVLSLHSFVVSFKEISLKSDFIPFFSRFNTYIAPGQGNTDRPKVTKF